MLNVIVNSTSGKGKGARALRKVEKILQRRGVEYVVHKTNYPGHAAEIVRWLTKDGNCDILVMGGDGSLNEALNGVENFDGLRFGVIPCGTGNDFARVVGIPKKVKDALEVVLQGNARGVDFIQLDDRRAINCAGAGIDVDTLVKYAEIKRLHGKIKYYVALLSVLRKLKFHKATLELDGQTTEESVFMIAIANGSHIGGGMPISPLSDATDGLLNVVVINELKRSKVFGTLLKFLKGKHIYLPCTKLFTTKEATLTVLDEGKTEVDGEVWDGKKLHCVCVHDKLKMFLPNK